ncbi:MAG: FGGY-family carbohydrate kinase, partial [Nakamurella sp.]
VAGAIADALECLPGKAFHGRQVRLGGGGSTAVGWRQMLADTLDVQLQALDVPGASALGSAYTGALAADLIDEPTLLAALDPPTTPVAQPRPERADYYRARRLRSRQFFNALQSVARPAGRDLT